MIGETLNRRIIALLLCVSCAAILLVSCGFDPAGVASAPKPSPENPQSIPMAVYPAGPDETVSTPAWQSAGASCEGKALYEWKQPGTFTWRFSSPDIEQVSSFFLPETVYFAPSDTDCGWMSVGMGEIMKDIPAEGVQAHWSGSCRTTGGNSSKTISQQMLIQVIGWEEKKTALGSFRALKLKSVNQYTESMTPGVVEASDWYVCGYGRVYSESTESKDDTKYMDELISFTPASTNLAHVRYILADAQLINTAENYRAKVSDEETAEALRLWDAGVRVVNIAQFERKQVNGQWQIVRAGSETAIKGSDVILTSDPQP